MLQEVGPKDSLSPHSFTKLGPHPHFPIALRVEGCLITQAQGSLVSMEVAQSPARGEGRAPGL